jgi:hypothetical protein
MPQPGRPIIAAQQIDVVYLNRGRGRLVRLVDTLKAGRDQRFSFAN